MIARTPYETFTASKDLLRIYFPKSFPFVRRVFTEYDRVYKTLLHCILDDPTLRDSPAHPKFLRTKVETFRHLNPQTGKRCRESSVWPTPYEGLIKLVRSILPQL
mmetsp:Transcript_4939/g.10844  ORF Transcript_4939/g.10844 Transcript_4939/m.10844 type:complete len:105 (+) Transcript_4939:2975-3289(+)